MEYLNISKQINIKIFYESNIIEDFKCDINDKLEKIINEFCSKINIVHTSICFIYNGEALKGDDFKKSFFQVMNSVDKQSKKMSILAINKNLENLNNLAQSNDINIILLIDSQKIKKLKGKKGETLKNIIKKEFSDSDFNKLTFNYRNNELNLNNKFEDIANENDKKINRMIINVNHKEHIVINFVNNNSEEKSMVCFADDKLINICNRYCYENGGLNINNLSFQYENAPIDLEKTISQIYSDIGSQTNVIIPIISENGIREIQINVNEKNESSCIKEHKKLIIILSIISIIEGIIIFIVILKKVQSIKIRKLLLPKIKQMIKYAILDIK